MASSDVDHRRRRDHYDRQATPKQKIGWRNDLSQEDQTHDRLARSTPLDDILDICRRPPIVKDMDKMNGPISIFMISPFKYDPSSPNREPTASNARSIYVDRWDENHVRMPCSRNFTDKGKKIMWLNTCDLLRHLKTKCDINKATIADLKITIEKCAGRPYDMNNLEILINQIYSPSERVHFMSTVLSNICQLAIHVDVIFPEPPPLLRIGKSKSVTMSQRQASSLLACAFFCLFPHRSEQKQYKEYDNFQNPNFNRLYQSGPPEKIEKLRCILHYFQRITEKKPIGVISIRRYALPADSYPNWSKSNANLSNIHLTADKKIEDIDCVLQVDFANKYIGGGVLGNGCVQEEIRFSLCPEMLVSLLVCEVMEPNECVFLIGCERYSKYEGYAGSFKFAGNYVDDAPKDSWGRKWSHLVAMDAIFFRDPVVQYDIPNIKRELIKAYAAFRPRATDVGAENLFGIATGNWGCGVFNGDKQLKAIIQLMVASEAQRPLIYAAYCDRNFVDSFSEVYACLKQRKATVGNLYQYLDGFSTHPTPGKLFEYILKNPISSFKS